MDRRRVVISAAVVATVGVATALTLPAIAETDSERSTPPSAPRVSSAMFAALQRDLGLTAEQVNARLAKEAWARQTRTTLRQTLGGTYGGAWLSADGGQLVVGVTDPDRAAAVEAAGAEPRVVARSARQLDAIKQNLDRRANRAAASIPGWYVDPATNSVVVLSTTRNTAAVRSFLRASGVPADAIRVATTSQRPRLLGPSSPADPSESAEPTESPDPSESAPPPPDPDGLVIRGGDAYFIDGAARCSVGFSVEGGFVSAGHCGQEGSTTTGLDGQEEVAQGTFQASEFPGSDFSFVETNADWTPVAEVNSFGGENASGQGQDAAAGNAFGKQRQGGNGQQPPADPEPEPSESASDEPGEEPSEPPADADALPVAGSEEAPIGTSVCKFGSTTGASCGVIQALNVTVNFADPIDGQGTVAVNGLIQTDVCAEPGDSGGSLLAGDQAQGMVSGGSGDCTQGGQTFFQPLNEVLETLDLTLLTSN